MKRMSSIKEQPTPDLPWPPGLLTKTQVATALRMHERTVTSLMKRRTIPYIKLGAGRAADVRFDLAEVISAMKNKHGICAVS